MKKRKTVLILRTVDKKRQSHRGFQWPETGPVKAPDWDPTPQCGGGLHGLIRGTGAASLIPSGPDRLWQVVEVEASKVVDLGDKVKFPEGNVILTGTREAATGLIVARYPGVAVHFAKVTGGDGAKVTGGYGAKVTGGDDATVTGRDRATVTGGENSVLALSRYDSEARRIRIVTAYVGEAGIKKNIAYRLDDSGKFIEA